MAWPQKAEKLRSNLHLLASKPVNKHTVFVDSVEEAEAFDPAAHFGTAPELVDRAYNRARLEQLEHGDAVMGVETTKELKKVRKARERAYRELEEREARSSKMRHVIERMQLEKNVMVRTHARAVVVK